MRLKKVALKTSESLVQSSDSLHALHQRQKLHRHNTARVTWGMSFSLWGKKKKTQDSNLSESKSKAAYLYPTEKNHSSNILLYIHQICHMNKNAKVIKFQLICHNTCFETSLCKTFRFSCFKFCIRIINSILLQAF